MLKMLATLLFLTIACSAHAQAKRDRLVAPGKVAFGTTLEEAKALLGPKVKSLYGSFLGSLPRGMNGLTSDVFDWEFPEENTFRPGEVSQGRNKIDYFFRDDRMVMAETLLSSKDPVGGVCSRNSIIDAELVRRYGQPTDRKSSGKKEITQFEFKDGGVIEYTIESDASLFDDCAHILQFISKEGRSPGKGAAALDKAPPQGTVGAGKSTSTDAVAQLAAWQGKMKAFRIPSVAPHQLVAPPCSGCAPAGFYCTAPVKSLSDLHFKRVALVANERELREQLSSVEAIVVTVVTMAPNDMPAMLERGVIDCVGGTR